MSNLALKMAESSAIKQVTTFVLGENRFGIDVMKVQEVTNALGITKIPQSADYVLGLINLRGQIVTAIGLYELFKAPRATETQNNMTVICRADGSLLSLFVDSIGDVIEVEPREFELVPDTIQGPLRKYLSGVCKTKGAIISILDLDKLILELNQVLEKNK